MSKAEDMIAMQAIVAQASIDFTQRMRARNQRIVGRNKRKLKKSRRKVANKSRRRNNHG